MTRVAVLAVALGAAFGFVLAWGRLPDPDVIRDMLLLRDPFVFLVMGSAVGVGFAGVRLVRRVRATAIVTGEPLALPTERPEARHVAGGVLFGVGWALSNACPGPLLAQLGQGYLWGLWTLGGVVAGVLVFLSLHEPRRAVAVGGLASASAPE